MGQSIPARRAVLIAEPGAGSRSLRRSSGWSNEGVALETLRLLDTQAASGQILDLAGFFAQPDGWAILRGGVLTGTSEPTRLWREVIVLGGSDFECVRCNPFRVLPAGPPDDVGDAEVQLPPPRLERAHAEDDMRRLQELHAVRPTHRTPGELETLLAAVLESKHTLVTASTWSYDDVELLVLLLPLHLRCELTFHSYALSTPHAVAPRLVLTQLFDEWSFDPASGLWDHRLPGTAGEISLHARELATDLLALLDAPDHLAEAQRAYEAFMQRPSSSYQSLIEEVERLLRFARLSTVRAQGEVGTALRVVARAGVQPGPQAEAERACLVEQLHDGFAPDVVGAAVADLIRHGAMDPTTLAVVMERFMADRAHDPETFSRFARPLRGVAGEYLLASEGDATRRVLTMLLLLAAARSDATALGAAAVVPLDGELIERLGGVAAWSPTARPMVATALHALAAAQSPEGVADALAALAALRHEIEAVRPKLRLAEWGVSYARWAYRQLSPEQWDGALPIGVAVANLAVAVMASARATLDGRSDADLFRDMLERGMASSKPDFEGHSDAELFLGFLGVEGSRSRVAVWELGERADVLAHKVFSRIRAETHAGEPVAEGVHWSMVLLERVRRQEVHTQYLGMAVRLLVLSAGQDASALLRAYVERYPSIGLLLQEDEAGRALIGDQEFASAAVADEPEPEAGALEVRTELEEPVIILPERPADNRSWLLRFSERRRVVVAALVMVVVAVVAIGASRLLGGASDGDAATAPAGGAESALLALEESALDAASSESAAARLAEARMLFSAGDWATVLEVLSIPAGAAPPIEAFAWDSLLAHATLRHVERFSLGNATRRALLQETVYRATRGLAAITPFDPGADLLRLVRAEACILGPLECDENVVLEDLVLAARSTSREVSERAGALLRESGIR